MYISMYVRVQKPAGALHAKGETCTARKERAPKALYTAMANDKSFRLHCALSERDKEKETAYECKTQQAYKQMHRERMRDVGRE